MPPAENEKTEDGTSATITRANGTTEAIGATPARPEVTVTGLLVLLLLGYIVYKLVRR